MSVKSEYLGLKVGLPLTSKWTMVTVTGMAPLYSVLSSYEELHAYYLIVLIHLGC